MPAHAPWYTPYQPIISAWGDCPPGPAMLAQLNVLARLNPSGLPRAIVFSSQNEALGAAAYEAQIAASGTIPCRANWHDAWHAAVWLTFPRLKHSINARHMAALSEMHSPIEGQRGPTRDALTVFDESGVLWLTDDDALAHALAAFDWQTLFVKNRDRLLEHVSVFVIGHGLLERMAKPYLAVTGHALVIKVPKGVLGESIEAQIRIADVASARAIDGGAPTPWCPLPLLGIPGWWSANAEPGFYDNAAVFRKGRRAALSVASA